MPRHGGPGRTWTERALHVQAEHLKVRTLGHHPKRMSRRVTAAWTAVVAAWARRPSVAAGGPLIRCSRQALAEAPSDGDRSAAERRAPSSRRPCANAGGPGRRPDRQSQGPAGRSRPSPPGSRRSRRSGSRGSRCVQAAASRKRSIRPLSNRLSMSCGAPSLSSACFSAAWMCALLIATTTTRSSSSLSSTRFTARRSRLRPASAAASTTPPIGLSVAVAARVPKPTSGPSGP